jgi:pimeloyl-ACP methyl ester carboxylesterase
VRKLITILAAAGVTAAGAVLATPAGAAPTSATTSSTARTTAATPSSGSIKWGKCSDPNLAALKAQCGFLKVPLNYSHPNGPKISLAVSRILHTSPASKYQGIILTNPGGPGGSGLNLNAFLVPVLRSEKLANGAAAADDYDWIGFDPRGVGSSVPALTCMPNYFSPDRPNYVPTTAALVQTWLKRSKAYAQACAKDDLPLLQNDTTIDTARDMDSIRAALGQKQITYYGFSYGTYLGQVYSTMFPSHVRRMILDSNVDPRTVWYTANLNQDVAFNRNINIWFAWIAKYNKVYHLGSTETAVRNLFYKEEAALLKHPAGGVIGPDEWVDIFLTAAYYEQTWLQLGSAFAGYVHSNGVSTLVNLYEGTDAPGDDNGFVGYLAVECTDAQWPLSWAKWDKDNTAIYKESPFETWGNAWFNAPCLYWPAKASKPLRIDGRHVRNALLIDETLDAATPFPGSLEVRKLYPHSVLLAEPGGTTHADSLSGDLCVDGTIASYLALGKLPPRKPGNGPDLLCKPLPVPVPTSASVPASARTVNGLRSRPLPLVW